MPLVRGYAVRKGDVLLVKRNMKVYLKSFTSEGKHRYRIALSGTWLFKNPISKE